MTHPDSTPPDGTAAELHELVRAAELADVVMTHLAGARKETGEPVAGDGAGQLELSGVVQHAGESIRVRLGVTCEDPNATYRVEAVATFTLDDERAVRDALLNQFARDAAATIVYPYLRAAVYSLATQLRLPVPQLPLLPSDGIGRDGDLTQRRA